MTKTRYCKKTRRIIIHLEKQKQIDTSEIKQAITEASREMEHKASDTPISEFMKGMLKICFGSFSLILLTIAISSIKTLVTVSMGFVNKFVLIVVALLCILFCIICVFLSISVNKETDRNYVVTLFSALVAMVALFISLYK